MKEDSEKEAKEIEMPSITELQKKKTNEINKVVTKSFEKVSKDTSISRKEVKDDTSPLKEAKEDASPQKESKDDASPQTEVKDDTSFQKEAKDAIK